MYQLLPHQIAVRQTLKGMYYNWQQQMTSPFEIVDQAIVNGEQWYTVRVCRGSCLEWVLIQDINYWYQIADWEINCIRFDMHKSLYTLLVLRWA